MEPGGNKRGGLSPQGGEVEADRRGQTMSVVLNGFGGGGDVGGIEKQRPGGSEKELEGIKGESAGKLNSQRSLIDNQCPPEETLRGTEIPARFFAMALHIDGGD